MDTKAVPTSPQEGSVSSCSSQDQNAPVSRAKFSFHAMENQKLGDRMKEYEATFGKLKLDPNLPFIVRCDGYNFSNFMRIFDKPHDSKIHAAMLLTTHDMVYHFPNCVCGFTCSDEITLIFPASGDSPVPVPRSKSETAGRVVKNVTLYAGFASAAFYRNLLKILQEDPRNNESLIALMEKTVPHFDARIFNVPNNEEVVHNIKWRHLYDYRRISINALAQKHFNSKAIAGLHSQQLIDKLLAEKEIDWNDMPGWYKWGAFVKKQRFTMPLFVGKKGHDDACTVLVSKIRTVTRIFEMSLDPSKEDDDFILSPFVEFVDPSKGFYLSEKDQKDTPWLQQEKRQTESVLSQLLPRG